MTTDMDKLRESEAEIARLREQYEDLIMQVVCKFPGETRHETAKRYIMDRENREVAMDSNQARAALGGDDEQGGDAA